MDRNSEFLDKLEKLLEEYDASIGWSCSACSDTHGIYDEVMYIESGNTTVLEIPGGCVDHLRIKEERSDG